MSQTTTFSDLRNHAKHYFDAVEAGETIEVYRHGKPVAILSPYRTPTPKRSSRRPASIGPFSLSQLILDERESNNK